MKLVKQFLIITSITYLLNCDTTPHWTPRQWLNFIKESISFNLRHNLKLTMVSSTSDILERYVKIWNICFVPKNFLHCNGHLKGLCGSVGIVTDRLMDCMWELEVHKGFCINVTVDHFPNGDPFVNDYFQLSVMDRGKADGINFYLNQELTSIITNNSHSLIQLKLLKLITVSKLIFHFQIVHCNVMVSYNSITFIEQKHDTANGNGKLMLTIMKSQSSEKLSLLVKSKQSYVIVNYNTAVDMVPLEPHQIWTSQFMPYAYHFHSVMTEYHILFRTTISTYAQAIYRCTKHLSLYDGPNFKSPKLTLNCQGEDILTVTANSFQLYLVYKQYHQNTIQQHLNLSFGAARLSLDNENFIQKFIDCGGNKAIEMSWDFTNTSQSFHEITFLACQGAYLTHQIFPSYYKDGPHGFLCQFHGLLLATWLYTNQPEFQIGPLCSLPQLFLARNKSLSPAFSNSESHFMIIYSYGLMNFKGRMIISKKSLDSACVRILNPCRICSLPQDLLYVNLRNADWYGIDLVGMECNKEIPVFKIYSKCILFQLTSNYIPGAVDMCQWQVISLGISDLRYTISFRQEVKSNICKIIDNTTELYEKFVTETYQTMTKIVEYRHQFYSRSHLFKINYDCFSNNFLEVLAEPRQVSQSRCKTVTLNSLANLLNSPKFDGPCFIFSLEVTDGVYAFNVSFLSEWKSAQDYRTRFAVGANLENLRDDQRLTGRNNIAINIFDNIFLTNTVYSYQFTEEDMPFYWQSYGQNLGILVNASYRHESPLMMSIIVNALYESLILITYLANPESAIINTECFNSGKIVFYGKCLSIHKNFSGNWYESERVCKKQGDELWSANNAKVWSDSMQSERTNWYLDYIKPVTYDKHLNVISLLQESSIVFLGMYQYQVISFIL